MLKKIWNHTAFSFFRFYAYTITGNKKKYKEITKHPNSFFIFITPLVFLLIHVLVGAFTLSSVASLIIWLPLFIGNLLFVLGMSAKYDNMKRKEDLEKRIKEKEERDKRIMEEIYREFIRAQEQQRREEWARQERARKEAWEWHEKARKAYREQSKGYGYSHSEYTYQTNDTGVDQNYLNAMKLMGLREGFTKDDLRRTYRKLSIIHHPDNKKTGSDANFKRLGKAYNYLLERI